MIKICGIPQIFAIKVAFFIVYSKCNSAIFAFSVFPSPSLLPSFLRSAIYHILYMV